MICFSGPPAEVDSTLSVFTNNVYNFVEPPTKVPSPIVAFSLSSGGAAIRVGNLPASSPIYITIPASPLATGTPQCRYWNTTTKAFATDGCVVSVRSLIPDDSVLLVQAHTTFARFY